MMLSIPALAELDLRHTLEGDAGFPITLITPSSQTITTTIDGRTLVGYVRRSYTDKRENNDKITINAPVVKLRITSLAKIPLTGETWQIGIPKSPTSQELEFYNLDPKKPVEVNNNTGTVKLYLIKLHGGIV